MYRELVLCLLLCCLTTAVPETDTSLHHHHLWKRQSSCPGVFFLEEPPTSLQCNPQPGGTLTLNCKFLVGSLNSPVPLSIGWFFSPDQRVGQLIQVSRFQANVSFSAFENVLEVLNAMPGAYFCSVGIAGVVLDSNALRVGLQTLQDLCLPQELPTLQPPRPRCAVRGLPINPTPLVVQTRLVQTNTVNLQMGVVEPTPTYSVVFERTMNIPEELVATPTVTPTVTPTTQPEPVGINATQPVPDNASVIGIGVGVGIAAGVLLTALVTTLIAGAICFIKKRERNLLFARKRDPFRSNASELANPNQEPLIAPPPGRPPPVLRSVSATPSPALQVDLIQYTPPQTAPQPYEVSPRTLRYTGGPRTHKNQSTPHSSFSPPPLAPRAEASSVFTHEGRRQSGSDAYYSRPKFKKFTGSRLSTSTHGYWELKQARGSSGSSGSIMGSSSTYISPQNLEPFNPPPTLKKIREDELMLGDKEEEVEVSHITTEFSPSGSESEQEESNEPSVEYVGEPPSAEYSLKDTTSWIKSPATGQSKLTESKQHHYVNITRSNPLLQLEETEETEETEEGEEEEEVKYVNTLRPGHGTNIKHTAASTRSAPSSTHKKPRKNKSTLVQGEEGEEEEYTTLVHDTFDSPTVYTSTPNKQRSKDT